ncbi:MAG: DUF4440 domain-containing protein [Acidobacteriota bacterium]
MLRIAFLTLGLISAGPAASGDPAPSQAPSEASEPSFEKRCAQEVEDLHRFFHDWFVGVLPDTEEAFERFATVMSEGFVIVSPSGNVTERADLLGRLRQAHGSAAASEGGGIKIWIRNLKVRRTLDDLAVVTYEEWQQRGEEQATGRVSTALLRNAEGKPAGVEWLHLHETWLPR